MQIRPATPEDTAPILELGRVLHAESVFRDYPLDTARVEAAIAELLSHPGHACRQWAVNRGASEVMVSVNSGVGLEGLPRLMERLHFRQVGVSFTLRLEANG